MPRHAAHGSLAHVQGVFALGPAQGDHLPALRVGLSVALPSVLLLAFGRPDLIVYAVFGAFTAMYGRAEPHQLRLRHQSRAAVFLLTGVSVGVLLSAGHVQSWGLVATETFLSGVGSLAADRAGLRPAGPFFGIFALGACASIPVSVPVWLALLICAGSAAFSILIGFAGWFRSRAWQPGAVRLVTPLQGPQLSAALVHASRYVLAVGAAGSLGLLTGIGHAYWAMAAAAVPLSGADLSSRVRRGIHRILGTFAGLGLTALILWSGPGTTLLAVLVIVLQFPTELFMVRHYGLALVFFTPLILLMTQLANPIAVESLVTDRGVETFMGALIGIAVVLAIREPRPRPPRPAFSS